MKTPNLDFKEQTSEAYNQHLESSYMSHITCPNPQNKPKISPSPKPH